MGQVLAIDASLSSTGYCVMNIGTYAIVEASKINTTTKEGQGRRFEIITDKLQSVLKDNEIDVIIVEEPFTGKNKKTSNKLQRLIGCIEMMASINKIMFLEKSPSSVRKDLMGNGSAKKEEVAEFIDDIYKEDETVMSLGGFIDRACKAKTSDIYDAISIARSYCNKI